MRIAQLKASASASPFAIEIMARGPFAAEPVKFDAWLAALHSSALAYSYSGASSDYERPTLKVDNGVATIGLRGLLMKRPPSWACEYGWATDLVAFVELCHEATERADIKSVVLDINSPGGTVAGTAEGALAVRVLAATKTVEVIIEDLCASAAYWIAAQATRIRANATALVGSIGVFEVLYDASSYSEQIGVLVDVVRSAPLKGVGVFGAPISDGQRAKEQSLINDAAALFAADVSTGRPSLDIGQVATGEMWLAAEAQSLGLIDEVVGRIETEGDQPEPDEPPIEPPSEDGDPAEAARPPRQRNGARAQGDQKMANENQELAALRAELERERAASATLAREKAALEVEREAQKQAAAAAREANKVRVIQAGVTAGRVTPALRASVEAYAKHVEADALEAFIAALPQQVSPTAIGSTPSQTDQVASAKDQARFAGLFPGLDPEFAAAASTVKSINAQGFATLNDGRVVPVTKVGKAAN